MLRNLLVLSVTTTALASGATLPAAPTTTLVSEVRMTTPVTGGLTSKVAPDADRAQGSSARQLEQIAQDARTALLIPDSRLAYRWAPIIIQGVQAHGQDSDHGRSDLITAVDFDGDWRGKNNWNHAEDGQPFPLVAKVYYTVARTDTHWYITYAIFHPRDWADYASLRNKICGVAAFLPFGSNLCALAALGEKTDALDRHENDMEGLMLVVERPASRSDPEAGRLVAMMTVCHEDFFGYTAARDKAVPIHGDGGGSSSVKWKQDAFGTSRPLVYSEAQTHCVTGTGHDGSAEWWFQEQDYQIQYSPVSWLPSAPSTASRDRTADFVLVDLKVLWEQRNNPDLFVPGRDGVFRGDDGQNDSAKAPWAWSDHDDESSGGEMIFGPRYLFVRNFRTLTTVGGTYESRNLGLALPISLPPPPAKPAPPLPAVCDVKPTLPQCRSTGAK